MSPKKVSSFKTSLFLHPLAVLLLLVSILESANGHGRLIEPPGRSTMWNYGFNTPKNYDDNGLNCGGKDNQIANGGKCGICGDPYQGPRENEAGGKFATGTIARKYTKGQTIDVRVEVTANHLGWFEFKLCPNNNPHKAATQECLDRHVLQQADGSGSKFTIDASTGVFHVKLMLPEDVTCTQCVLQWRWHVANSYGYNDDGKGCMGCGPQEEFYGCADVQIGQGPDSNPQPIDSHLPVVVPQPNPNAAAGSYIPKPVYNPPTPSNVGNFIPVGNQAPVTPSPVVGSGPCRAVSPLWRGRRQYDAWCDVNCRMGTCPPALCAC